MSAVAFCSLSRKESVDDFYGGDRKRHQLLRFLFSLVFEFGESIASCMLFASNHLAPYLVKLSNSQGFSVRFSEHRAVHNPGKISISR